MKLARACYRANLPLLLVGPHRRLGLRAEPAVDGAGVVAQFLQRLLKLTDRVAARAPSEYGFGHWFLLDRVPTASP